VLSAGIGRKPTVDRTRRCNLLDECRRRDRWRLSDASEAISLAMRVYSSQIRYTISGGNCRSISMR
jgi:hypothetical protein